MGATEGNGAGILSPPSIATATPITSSPPATAARDGKPVEGEGSPPTDPAQDRRAAVRKAIAANSWGASTDGGQTVVQRMAARVEARRTGRERAVATPWESVNSILGGGLWPGFHVIVGATGAGKSQIALQLALHAAKAEGIPCLYLALELDGFGLFCRASALVSQGRQFPPVQWSELYTGKAPLPLFAAGELGALPFHWCEAPPHGFPYDDVLPAIEAVCSLYPNHKGPVFVVLDFLQLVASPPGVREELRERIGRAAYQCRGAARDMNAVVIALSSTARPSKGASDPLYVTPSENGRVKLPPLHDLVGLGKESGDVEYSADSVLVLCREAWPKGDGGKAERPKGGTRVHIGAAKLRAGVPGWAHLSFNGTSFATAPEPATDAAPSNDSEPPAVVPAEPRKRSAKRSAPPPTPDPREPREPDDTREDD